MPLPSVDSPALQATQSDTLSEPATGYGPVLKNSSFVWLWMGQVFSQLADRVVFVVFIATLFETFGASDSYSNYLYIAFTIPAILFTAIAGAFIDRWPRKIVLVGTNLIRAALMFTLPWVISKGLLALYTLAFAISSVTQFFVPAEAATIPVLVSKKHLVPANSLFTTTMMGSVIFGFALGDPLINLFTLQKVHWAVGSLFLLAALCLMMLRHPRLRVAVPKRLPAIHVSEVKAETEAYLKVSRGVFEEIRESLEYIRRSPPIANSIGKLALLFSVVVVVCILFISFAKAFLYANPAVAARKFAYIITFSGLGMALGAFLTGQYFSRINRHRLVSVGFLTVGFCLWGLCGIQAIDSGWVAFHTRPLGVLHLSALAITARMIYTYCLAFVMGMGAAFVAIPLQALLHEQIPKDHRGKILGVQFTVLSTCSTLPVILAGVGVEHLGTVPMFWMVGLPLVWVGLQGFIAKTPVTPSYVDTSTGQ